jgi:hypothetical protein
MGVDKVKVCFLISSTNEFICLYLDASAPTLVNNKANLHKGDLFVTSLNDDGTQKLVMQVDEERTGPSANPGY